MRIKHDFGPLTFGFDIGIASVGWAVLSPTRIVDLGVRCFDKAENKDGEPLNLARREQRTARNRLARRALRLQKLRRALRASGLIECSQADALITPPRAADERANDPWTLRVDGLDRKLSRDEWARVIYHIVKHRGFHAVRKSEALNDDAAADVKAKEKQGLLSGIARTSALLNLAGGQQYRTAGELAVKEESFAQAKRNKQGSYQNSFSRKLLREELRELFTQQQSLGNEFANEKLYETVDNIFWSQKAALSGEAMLALLGKCTFERGEFRAAKHTWTAERFVWLTRLNNIRLSDNGENRLLNDRERALALPLPYARATALNYKTLRDEIGLPEHIKFNLNYPRAGSKDEKKNIEFDTKLIEMKGFHTLRKAFTKANLEGSWQRISQQPDLIDAIATSITILKTDDELATNLIELGLSDAETEAMLKVSFSDFLALSLKALRNIIQPMENGNNYREACEQFNYKPELPEHRSKLLPPLFKWEKREVDGKKKIKKIPFVPNPVVSRALNQSRGVLNALIREHGSPIAVHIELARDLSKSLKERREIEKGQKEFGEQRKAAVLHFQGQFDGVQPRAKEQDLLKYRMYREQNGQCAYTGNEIRLGEILSQGYVEIDHVLPYSRSFDDSQNNKVLVLTAANRDKGDRTPYEWFGTDVIRWQQFQGWVTANKTIRKPKRDRLLRKDFLGASEEGFAERNLNDTRYATRAFAQFVRETLEFAPSELKIKVLTPSGGFTSFMRARWGLHKNREGSDLHHAQDACVIAAASHSLIKRVSDYSRQREWYVESPDKKLIHKATGEIIDSERFPRPWKDFHNEVIGRLAPDPKAACKEITNYTQAIRDSLKPIWVSRASRHRDGGALHQETIRSAKRMDEGISTAKVMLNGVQFFPAKSRKKDEQDAAKVQEKLNEFISSIVGATYSHNYALVGAIRERLEAARGDGSKAFPLDNPLRKPSSNKDKIQPIVRSVKIQSTQKGGVHIRGGIADQASMWRVDVFTKDKKFFLVPIYQSDRGKKELPNRAVFQGKKFDAWPVMNESFQFLFSVTMNDPVRFKQKDKPELVGYFGGLDASTGNINIWIHDRDKRIGKDGLLRSLGPKTADIFEKLHVDVLGNLYNAKNETRRGLA